ncbi:MAG: hypothetical protein AAB804_01690 [Patescibacteria group bacterium]
MKACMVRGAFTFIAVSIVLLTVSPAHAQLGLPSIEKAVSIKFEPLHPGPGDTVRLDAHSAVLDLSTSEIAWRANGKTIAQGVGVERVEVNAGSLGKETVIDVFVLTSGGVAASAEAAIIPTELDLLIDADSYVPPFYLGRPHVSAGSTLLLQAVPHFKRPDGTMTKASDVIYTWKKNGEVLGSISGRGRSNARIPIQHLYGTENISIEARTSDNLLSNGSSLSISPIQPVLVLYQDHPLYGVLYHQALGVASSIAESEATFAATPYFAGITGQNDPALTFDWSVNGKTLPQSATRPEAITINADNSSGIAVLRLELTHATNFYMDAKGLWNVTFSTAAVNNQLGVFGL